MKRIICAGVTALAVCAGNHASAATLYDHSGIYAPSDAGLGLELLTGEWGEAYQYAPQTIRIRFDVLSAPRPDPLGYLVIQAVADFRFPDGWVDRVPDWFADGELGQAGSMYGSALAWAPTATGFVVTVRDQTDKCQRWRAGETCSSYQVGSLFYFNPSAVPFEYRFTISSVPEPATWGMLIIGFMSVGASLRRSRLRSKYRGVEVRRA